MARHIHDNPRFHVAHEEWHDGGWRLISTGDYRSQKLTSRMFNEVVDGYPSSSQCRARIRLFDMTLTRLLMLTAEHDPGEGWRTSGPWASRV